MHIDMGHHKLDTTWQGTPWTLSFSACIAMTGQQALRVICACSIQRCQDRTKTDNARTHACLQLFYGLFDVFSLPRAYLFRGVRNASSVEIVMVSQLVNLSVQLSQVAQTDGTCALYAACLIAG